jgi:hypothetical protein
MIPDLPQVLAVLRDAEGFIAAVTAVVLAATALVGGLVGLAFALAKLTGVVRTALRRGRNSQDADARGSKPRTGQRRSTPPLRIPLSSTEVLRRRHR